MPLFSETVERMDAFPAKLQALLANVEPEALSFRAYPEDWSIMEIVWHLDDVDALMRGRIEAALASDNPPVPVYEEKGPVQGHDFTGQTFDDVLQGFLKGRASFMELLKGLTPEQLSRTVTHPMHGAMSCERIPASLPKHDLNHYNQIAGTLELYAFSKQG